MTDAIQRSGPGLTTGQVDARPRPTLRADGPAPARAESCDRAPGGVAGVRIGSPRGRGRPGETAVVGLTDPAGVPPQRLPGVGTGTRLLWGPRPG